jgi:glycerol uptake facilitator protein
MDKNLRAYLVELLGTFAVVFVAAGAVCGNAYASLSGMDSIKPGLVGIALAYGLVYAAALAVVLPHSQGCMNPAITLMLWVFKRIDGGKAFGLIFVQLVGAALAGLVLRAAYNQETLTAAHMGAPHLNLQSFGDAGISAGVLLKGVAIEAGITFVLGFIIYGSIIDPRCHRLAGEWGKRLIGLWVGLALTAITLAAFPFTGAAANPARWFGTIIWAKSVPALNALSPFSDHMVYWFGPIAGALVAGVLYNMLVLPTDENHAESHSAHAHTHKVASGASATLFRARK